MATVNVYNVPYSGDSSIAAYAEDHKVQYVSSIEHRITYGVIGVQHMMHTLCKLWVTDWNKSRRCEYKVVKKALPSLVNKLVFTRPI